MSNKSRNAAREHYDKICSSLYRHYERDIDAENFKIETAQTEMLKEAKGYTQERDNFAVLAELQYYGGKTNLIDFTTDYLIALFFACDGSHDDDGRVLLVKHITLLRTILWLYGGIHHFLKHITTAAGNTAIDANMTEELKILTKR